DVVRFHSRRRAAGACHRRRRERAQIHWHHGVLRHARFDLPRGAVRAGVLRGGATLGGMAAGRGRTEGGAGCWGVRAWPETHESLGVMPCESGASSNHRVMGFAFVEVTWLLDRSLRGR